MFKASFVCYRSDKYLNANEALNANAMFQPSSNLSAWEFNDDSTSEVKELVEICTMYNEIPSKSKSFGIIISNVFVSASDVAKNSQLTYSPPSLRAHYMGKDGDPRTYSDNGQQTKIPFVPIVIPKYVKWLVLYRRRSRLLKRE